MKKGYFKVLMLVKHAQKEDFAYSEHAKLNMVTATQF